MVVNPQEGLGERAAIREVAQPTVAEAGAPVRQASLWRDAWYRYRANRAAVVAAILFLLLVLYVVVVPFFPTGDPYAVDFSKAYLPMSWQHPFGTDQFGRDLFTGVGINPPKASWGSLAQDGRDVYLSHPLIIVFPSVAIAYLILCAFFIADGLRDALDPRTRET